LVWLLVLFLLLRCADSSKVSDENNSDRVESTGVGKGTRLGRSYSDPQEGLSVFSFLLLLANREISIRAATAETPTVTTTNSEMISIFWFCLRF
jgi:hypothetical protein